MPTFPNKKMTITKSVKNNFVTAELPLEFARLFAYIQKLNYGELVVFIQNGLPIRVVKSQSSILLSDVSLGLPKNK